MAKRINEDFTVYLANGEEYNFKHISAPMKCIALRRDAQRFGAYFDIYDAYQRPSAAKVKAWENCKALCDTVGGICPFITGKNCSQFTVMFYFTSPSTGVCSVAKVTKGGVVFCDDILWDDDED